MSGRLNRKDRKVCTFEDFTIFESDYKSICSSWLTDTAVNFAATYVLHNIMRDEKNQICIVYAYLCEMVKYIGPDSPDEIKELLDSAEAKPDKWCFFLLNDCADPTAVCGGTHWTLLAHDPYQKTLFQLDPMINTRPMHCISFYTKIRPYFDDEYKVLPCPKMSLNGSCGIYVVEYIHNILKYIKNGGRNIADADLSGIDDRYAVQRRVFYCDVINQLAVEQKKEPIDEPSSSRHSKQ